MPLSGYTAAPTTGDSLAAQAPKSVRNLWAKGVEVFEQNYDYFKQFEGPSKTFPIHSRTDLSKGRGQKIVFTSMAGLHHEPHLGEELFENGSHFEEVRIGDDELEVDWYRHGLRYTERGEEKMGMRGELAVELPDRLGEWLGRLKTEKLMMMFIHQGDARNRMIINNRGSANALLPSDTIDYAAITSVGAKMQTTTGRAAYVGRDASGNPIHKHVFVSSSDALYSLDLDPAYQAAKKDAGSRGPENLIFKAGYYNLRGQVIKEYTAIDHDGAGAIGSPINPKAELGKAITAGTAAFDIYGGGYEDVSELERVHFFKWFPNFAYPFMYQQFLDVSSPQPFYVIVYNLSGAEAGKFGFYKCLGNDGRKLTVTERLAAADGDGPEITKEQVGNVVWDAGKNTVAHPEGSLVLLASENGAPIGHTIVMGAAGARRGYGKYARRRVTDEHEGGFVRDVFIQSVFGQAPRRDARGRASSHLILTHAISYPGIAIEPELAD